jgi:hypothetical protein
MSRGKKMKNFKVLLSNLDVDGNVYGYGAVFSSSVTDVVEQYLNGGWIVELPSDVDKEVSDNIETVNEVAE